MPDLAAEIHMQDDLLRISWRWNNKPVKSYLIDPVNLQSESNAIRGHLKTLVDKALAREKALLAGDDESAAKASKERLDALNQLMRCGARLYGLLFSRQGGDADQAYVERIRREIAKLGAGTSIGFYVSPRLKVPWGLVYEDAALGLQKIPAARAKDDPDEFANFWCLKHSVSALYGELARRLDDSAEYPASAFSVLCGGNLNEWTSAASQLSHPDEKQALHAIHTVCKPVASSDELVDTWTSLERKLGLLYLYCHANASQIQFTKLSDTMDAVAFEQRLQKSAEKEVPECLVLLNGCHTAADNPSGTFMGATAREGFCGYIGTETDVPKHFAFRFGLAFHCLLYSGVPVGKILDDLRRQHWPLGLVYSLYALPNLRIAPDPAVAFPVPPALNYSDGPLGDTAFRSIP